MRITIGKTWLGADRKVVYPKACERCRAKDSSQVTLAVGRTMQKLFIDVTAAREIKVQ
jgi:hypothetical protein